MRSCHGRDVRYESTGTHDDIPNARRLQIHLIHIRIPLHEAERLIERVGLRASGLRGETKVDGRKLGPGEIDNAL